MSAKPIQQSSSSIEMYQTYLKGVYSVKQLPVDEKYPIDCVKHFVNLECADVPKHLTKREAEEFRSCIMRGNISSIRKEKVTMDQVAAKQDDSYPNLVLVKGAPGVGKTTFSWELCRRWSAGKLLTGYSLVVLLKLRDANVQEARNVSDLFQYRDSQLSTHIAEDLEPLQGKGVLFILEGLDELPQSLREDKNSMFMDLIAGRLLPASTVMVTTRPWAVEHLPKSCENRIDQHIEILGFTEKQVDEYVDHMIKDGVPEGLRTYVSANPHISSAMYNPLHARIVVEVYRECSEENESIFPNTTTELYTAYSTIIIHRYLTDHPADQQWGGDLNALPPSVEPHFKILCRVAYDGITKEKQQLVFSKADIPDGNATLGFMNSVQPLHRTVTRATSPSYNFLHFTLQEYLAAVYIWKKHTPQQHMILFETKFEGTYKMILIFLAGLTKLEGEYTRCVLPIPLLEVSPLPEVSEHSEICVRKTFEYSEKHIFLLYESQNDDAFQAGEISAFSIPSDEFPQYYFALGYCLASSKSFLKLTINTSQWICNDWKMLVAGARKCSSPTAKLKYLTVRLQDCSEEDLTATFDEFFKHFSIVVERFTLSSGGEELPKGVLNLLNLCHSLKEVELSQLNLYYLDEQTMATVFQILGSKPCLERLTFELGATYDLKMLSDLMSSSKLKTLILIIPVGNYRGRPSITLGFNVHKFVQNHELDLVQKISDDLFGDESDVVMLPIATGIFKINRVIECVTLQHLPRSLELLNLSQCGLDRNGLSQLATSITACTSLKELHVSIVRDPHFASDKNGLQVMAEALKSIQTLHVTDYSGYLYVLLSRLDQHSSVSNLAIEVAVISKREAAIFAGLLRNSTSLQVVDIHSKVMMDGSDFALIVDALQRNIHLKQLKIADDIDGPGFEIISEGAKSMVLRATASMLKMNRTLEVLDISSFKTECLMSKQIAQALCINTTLRVLKLHHPMRLSPFANIGCEDIAAFGKMLTRNKSLHVLHLTLEPTESYVHSLMKGLIVNKTLEELGLPDDHEVKDSVITCPEYYVTNVIYRVRFLPRYDSDEYYD